MNSAAKINKRVSIRWRRGLAILLACATWGAMTSSLHAGRFTGRIVDHDNGEPVPARVYVEDSAGQWLYVQSASSEGTALAYREQWVPTPQAVERHTTLSAHPFRVDLQPGRYQIQIERGKEYLPLSVTIEMGEQDQAKTFRLRRWINMAERGWYSGETHVHRRIRELPNVQLAEDLNVSFPVTFWTVKSAEAPGLSPSPLRRQGPSPFGPRQDKGSPMISIDESHVIFPRNTEYEIFSVGERRPVLGAAFILNPRTRFETGAPPVRAIAEKAHREGALLDLDKHSWPWSMMLVPIAKIDLYELSNNSLWRTEFGFKSGTPPAYMKIERTAKGLSELGWIQFGLQNYYALLNCGFRIQPTAGTASGVHPVPLGFSRVYVQSPRGFTGQKWIDGLRKGRSFVTTEPILLATVDKRPPGETFQQETAGERTVRGEAVGPKPLSRIEIIVNGQVAKTITATNTKTERGAYRSTWTTSLNIKRTSWIAVRAFRFDKHRVRFAHTAPWRVIVDGQPMRPRQEEIDFLISRVQSQIERNRSVIGPESLLEFEQALKIYQEIAKRALADGMK